MPKSENSSMDLPFVIAEWDSDFNEWTRVSLVPFEGKLGIRISFHDEVNHKDIGRMREQFTIRVGHAGPLCKALSLAETVAPEVLRRQAELDSLRAFRTKMSGKLRRPTSPRR